MATLPKNSVLIALVASIAHLPRLKSIALAPLPPHSGYHGSTATPFQPFFEGWYLRVSPRTGGGEDQKGESYCCWDGGPLAFIFHVFDPHLPASKRRGVGMQVLTPKGTAVVESSDLSSFSADSHSLDVKNDFGSEIFFHLTGNRVRGRATDNGGLVVDFDLDVHPQIGWGGGPEARQYSTAGWLAALPVFEPHYQVCISRGVASGSVTVQNLSAGEKSKEKHLYQLTDALVYCEKNWGGAFPSAWWWIQANNFGDCDLCVTSTGGQRRLPLTNQQEQVALVGLHWNGSFLPFPDVDWTVRRWGFWRVRGRYEEYEVKLTGSCQDKGSSVLCPTDSGMKAIALESYRGNLRVELYQHAKLVLDVSTSDACLETGGLPWTRNIWTGRSAMAEPLGSFVMNTDFERAGADAIDLINRLFIDIPGL